LVGDLADMSKEAVEKQGVPADSMSAIPPEDIERIPEDEQLRAAVDKGTFTSDPVAVAAAAAGAAPPVPREVPWMDAPLPHGTCRGSPGILACPRDAILQGPTGMPPYRLCPPNRSFLERKGALDTL